MNPIDLSQFIKKRAKEYGFDSCGISKAQRLDDEAFKLEQWLNQNRHGQMSYMENHFDKRIDPTKLVENAKSVISFTYNYFTSELQTDREAPKISRYAYGRDYHKVIKKKLKSFIKEIKETAGDINARGFVDSAPILERVWAQKSGLGWIGKNSLMLSKKKGSYFFLAEIITDLVLEYDSPVKDYCGSCTKCIDACPTDAIYEPYKVDGSKCISYFTVELKDQVLPNEMKGKFNNWMFGCDICQEVCPINARSKEHNEEEFLAHPDLLSMNKQDWLDLKKETFEKLFKSSPVKRTKFEGLKRNIRFLMKD